MNGILLDTIVIATSLLLAASVVLALYRVIRGPSILDRMIATDVVLASMMCGLGGFMAMTGRTDLLPVLIVLAMLGFVGSVSVSRYVSKSDSMTTGAEVGSLGDFSASDWHVGAQDEAPGDADAQWPDDVARGIANVSDGPAGVTVGDDEAHQTSTRPAGADDHDERLTGEGGRDGS
ncbi:multisubunit Na+/H+ antiporter MnhF subunit [Brevibacterium sanguinis]|uniref:Multisubunit Na+/H+ antiporter MnhF subunit n=2 Tax=Brevibacterium TaxID=1696 RepID=A0A366IPA3_9MICO|nr:MULTISPECIES: monovalent cation/H+ antiporter complex subunit F [Brevibacterium]RBP67085.1 multisubunit Na+/H+ antiporter MnhF subunit [Brevibacterium sanguinis]RBP73610.1 multisubunit Na+/H+ antiporter MnhF subunit [Brevibacterium celere]